MASFLESLIEVLPRTYLNQIAKEHCGIADPLPVVRSSLKSRIMRANSPTLNMALAQWVADQLVSGAIVVPPQDFSPERLEVINYIDGENAA